MKHEDDEVISPAPAVAVVDNNNNRNNNKSMRALQALEIVVNHMLLPKPYYSKQVKSFIDKLPRLYKDVLSVMTGTSGTMTTTSDAEIDTTTTTTINNNNDKIDQYFETLKTRTKRSIADLNDSPTSNSFLPRYSISEQQLNNHDHYITIFPEDTEFFFGFEQDDDIGVTMPETTRYYATSDALHSLQSIVKTYLDPLLSMMLYRLISLLKDLQECYLKIHRLVQSLIQLQKQKYTVTSTDSSVKSNSSIVVYSLSLCERWLDHVETSFEEKYFIPLLTLIYAFERALLSLGERYCDEDGKGVYCTKSTFFNNLNLTAKAFPSATTVTTGDSNSNIEVRITGAVIKDKHLFNCVYDLSLLLHVMVNSLSMETVIKTIHYPSEELINHFMILYTTRIGEGEGRGGRGNGSGAIEGIQEGLRIGYQDKVRGYRVDQGLQEMWLMRDQVSSISFIDPSSFSPFHNKATTCCMDGSTKPLYPFRFQSIKSDEQEIMRWRSGLYQEREKEITLTSAKTREDIVKLLDDEGKDVVRDTVISTDSANSVARMEQKAWSILHHLQEMKLYLSMNHKDSSSSSSNTYTGSHGACMPVPLALQHVNDTIALVTRSIVIIQSLSPQRSEVIMQYQRELVKVIMQYQRELVKVILQLAQKWRERLCLHPILRKRYGEEDVFVEEAETDNVEASTSMMLLHGSIETRDQQLALQIERLTAAVKEKEMMVIE